MRDPNKCKKISQPTYKPTSEMNKKYPKSYTRKATRFTCTPTLSQNYPVRNLLLPQQCFAFDYFA